MFAHTRANQPESTWEPLEDHLQLVARMASEFGAVFNASDIARLAGLWHDLGKHSPEFQAYLRDSVAQRPTSLVDHSSAGAVHAQSAFKSGVGLTLAFVIAGHHAGLTSYSDSTDSSLTRRLDLATARAAEAIRRAAPEILNQPAPGVPNQFTSPPQAEDAALRVSLFIRMVFSCLIDADRLATEAFVGGPRAALRQSIQRPSIALLRQELDQYLARLSVKRSSSPAPVDVHRRAVLDACRDAAARAPGIFTLTAPTGSGKTFASMAFALAHAQAHGLHRVVYALPFTSITEQNAAAFREAFGPHGEAGVLEHHSAYRPRPTSTTTLEDEGESPSEVARRLATENWDAPVIVTTTVRLLESLFAASPTDCRPLHRLARSVIVLDEVQSLPVHLLRPTLAALQELADSYNASIVLCSATVPAIARSNQFPIGLRSVHEIIPEPERLAAVMRRTHVRHVGTLDDDSIAERICNEARALVIVNTRRHAARLFEMVLARGCSAIHLSALMCAAHRSDQVAHIKARLSQGHDCRVISTQVVEAGVDLDFPLVLRAMAGLDSIVQAAGRCNREGHLKSGLVEVFDTQEPPPPGIRAARDDAAQILRPDIDPLSLETIRHYFSLHYWGRKTEWDGGANQHITDILRSPRDPKRRGNGLAFRDAAEVYRIIDEWSEPVIVPYSDAGAHICRELIDPHTAGYGLLRTAQRYSVSVSPWILQRLVENGSCMLTASGTAVLVAPELYDADLGLRVDAPAEPQSLIV